MAKILVKVFLILFFLKHSGCQLLMGCVETQPQCPNENITFWFYTREKEWEPTVISLKDPESFELANFIKDRPLKIIIHGYTNSHDDAPNNYLRPAFFEKDEFNIISVDYESLAEAPCYISAVKNIQTVANCTAQLINYVIDNNIFSMDAIHVIGYSLGAQVIIIICGN